MHRTPHPQQITDRFRELVEKAGDALPPHHYDELSLLIEAGIDTALLEQTQKMADKLDAMVAAMRKDAAFFD